MVFFFYCRIEKMQEKVCDFFHNVVKQLLAPLLFGMTKNVSPIIFGVSLDLQLGET